MEFKGARSGESQAATDRNNSWGKSSRLSDRKFASGERPVSGLSHRKPFTQRRDKIDSTLWGLDADEIRERTWTTHSINWKACIALEVFERLDGLSSEDAVDTSGIESKDAQAPLKIPDVVTAQHRIALVEKSVAELVTRLNENRPTASVTDARWLDLPAHLELAQRLFG